jgi:hypothetical protein
MALKCRYCTAEISSSALGNSRQRILYRAGESLYHCLEKCGGLSQVLRGFAVGCSPKLGHDELVDCITFGDPALAPALYPTRSVYVGYESLGKSRKI